MEGGVNREFQFFQASSPTCLILSGPCPQKHRPFVHLLRLEWKKEIKKF